MENALVLVRRETDIEKDQSILDEVRCETNNVERSKRGKRKEKKVTLSITQKARQLYQSKPRFLWRENLISQFNDTKSSLTCELSDDDLLLDQLDQGQGGQ